MRNALEVLLLVAGIIYGIFYDATFWKIYCVVVTMYTLFVMIMRDSRDNPIRKTMTIASWDQPTDPTSYINQDFIMDAAQEYIKKVNSEQSEVHVTLTHLFAHAAAWGEYKMRRDVGRLPWGTFKKSERMGVTVLCDVDNGKDLVPVTINDGHKMTVFELAKFCGERVKRAKTGKDERHNSSVALANYVPSFLSGALT